MTDNIFIDKAMKPSPTQLATSLGLRSKYLDELKRHVGGSVVEEWKYYGKTLRWTLKLLIGNRNLYSLWHAEGRGIRLEIKSHRALERAMIFLDIKQGR